MCFYFWTISPHILQLCAFELSCLKPAIVNDHFQDFNWERKQTNKKKKSSITNKPSRNTPLSVILWLHCRILSGNSFRLDVKIIQFNLDLNPDQSHLGSGENIYSKHLCWKLSYLYSLIKKLIYFLVINFKHFSNLNRI